MLANYAALVLVPRYRDPKKPGVMPPLMILSPYWGPKTLGVM